MNQNGFAQVLFISLLPILISIFMLTFIGANYIHLQTRAETTCITEQMKAQKHAAMAINFLLDLNPIVIALKWIERGSTVAEVITTITNLLVSRIISALSKMVKLARKFIDKFQKTLITATNANIYTTTFFRIPQLIKTIIDEHFRVFQFWLNTESSIIPTNIYQLAIKADSNDVAPSYSIVRNKVKHMVTYNSWTIKLKPLETFKNFISGQHQATRSCGVKLVERNQRWQPQIAEDSLLRNFLLSHL